MTQRKLICQTSFGPQEGSDWRDRVADVIRRLCHASLHRKSVRLAQETFLSTRQPLIRKATITTTIKIKFTNIFGWHNTTHFRSFLSHTWHKLFCNVYFPFIKSKNFSASHFLLRFIENEKQNLSCTNFKKNGSKIKEGKAVQIIKEKFLPPSGPICAVNYSSFLNSHYLFTHIKLAE